MKKLVFSVLFVCASLVGFCQDDDEQILQFGLGGTVSIPTGDLAEDIAYGVGAEGTVIYRIIPHLHLFSQIGLGVFRANSSYYGDGGNLLNIPLMVGARVSFSGFSAGAGVGYGLWSGGGGSANGLLLSPQFGYTFGNQFQVLAHYTTTSVEGGKLSYFGIKFFHLF